MSQSRKSKKIQKQSSTSRPSSYSAVIGNRRTLRGKKNRLYKINPQPMHVNESKKTLIFLLEGNDGNQYVGKFIKLQKQIQAITQVYYLDKLKGKHICNLIDLVKNNEGIWIICQKGHTSLHSYLKNLRQEQVQVILRNIAIAYLPFYQSGIAHRDLKPGNIIIQQNLDVKLIDLQLCQKRDQRYGTLYYIPPHLKAIMWDSSDSYAYGLIGKQMIEKCFHFNQSLQQLIRNCVQSEIKWGWKEIYAFWGIDTNQQGMNMSNNDNNNNTL